MSKPTFSERCQIAQQLLPDAQYRDMLTALHAEMLDEVARLNKAVADEREACAKVCDDHATKDGFEGCYANACAESIRARGNT